MRACDLAQPFPAVPADDDTQGAARLMRKAGLSVAERLPRPRFTPAAVRPDVSVMHIGAITTDAVLDHFIGGS